MTISAFDIVPMITQIGSGEYADDGYDFHNDFKCIKFSVGQTELILLFEHLSEHYYVRLVFHDVKIDRIDFDFRTDFETIDLIYRGGYADDIKDVALHPPYFNIQFLNDHLVSFNSNSFSVEKHNSLPDLFVDL